MKIMPTAALAVARLPGLALALFCGDWTTFGHDPQHSGWAPEETILTRANVSRLELKSKARLKNVAYSLSTTTAPVVASGISTIQSVRSVVYVAGIAGGVFRVGCPNRRGALDSHVPLCRIARKGRVSRYVPLSEWHHGHARNR